MLALTGPGGRVDLVEASRLADLLRQARPMPRLVVLNSCSGAETGLSDLFSGTAAALVRSGISAVAAMQFAISDAAAVAFARGFYSAIAHGRGVDDAAPSGRVAILGTASRTLEWATPVLYLRGDETRLFTIQPGHPPARTASPATPGSASGTSAGPTVRSQPARTSTRKASGSKDAPPKDARKPPAAAPAQARTVERPAAPPKPSPRPAAAGPSRLAHILTHKYPVWGVAFSPDGTLLATASKDNTVRLWS